MAVFDKELIINGEAVRSPEQQVYKNMKDIKELKEIIKPEYTTDAVLTDASVSVAIANTNAPEGTTEGWLLTQDGLKFKITGGDDTNLLLEFYANLKGPQGEDGAAVNIDDNTTSLTKVWSSSKTANVIGGLINDSITSNINTWSSDQQTKLLSSGIAWTTTDKDGDDQISLNDIYIGARTAYESTSIIKVPMLKVSDLIVFVDGNLKAKTLYRVVSIASNIATVAIVCDFAGGKQLYKHIISVQKNDTPATECGIIITCDKSTQFTFSELKSYLHDNGFYVDTNNPQLGKYYPQAYGALYYSGSSVRFLGLTNYGNYISACYGPWGNGNLNENDMWNISDGVWNPPFYKIIPL